MKRKLKLLIVAILCMFYCASCDGVIRISPFTSSSSSSGTSSEVVSCSFVSTSSETSANESQSAFARLLAKKPSDIFKQVAKSTAIVAACYVVDGEAKEMRTSGFVFDKEDEQDADGNYTYYIMTNASGIFYRYIPTDAKSFESVEASTTVERNGTFEMIFQDGHRYISTAVGYYDNFDVAIFKFQSPEIIPLVEFGDSNELVVGDEITAIGTPIVAANLINTCVTGTVSGVNRMTNVTYSGYIGTRAVSAIAVSYPTFQFDAPINGGMEGGPVMNDEGQVVGMMSYKYSGDSAYESLSMAIASNDIKNIAYSILDSGSYVKPILGVTVGDVMNYQNLTSSKWIGENEVYKGLYIVTSDISADGIAAGSPAAKAGMVAGVVITQIIVNEVTYTIENLAHLSSILVQMKKNDTVKLVTVNSSKATNTYTLDLWS